MVEADNPQTKEGGLSPGGRFSACGARLSPVPAWDSGGARQGPDPGPHGVLHGTFPPHIYG